jgi:hypothetical protein
MEIKVTPTGVKIDGKLYNKPNQLQRLFAEQPKGQNRLVRKVLYANGLRRLAAITSVQS